ncbi:MAG: nucleotidyltransferase domain-containing protein [Candidatus Asgardarchaeia archaeon]
MREKVKQLSYQREVIYTKEHWELLAIKRNKAIRIMKAIAEFSPIVHGSIARGDVNKKSDIDIVILYPVSSFLIETKLLQHQIKIQGKYIVQATPKHTIKGQYIIDDECSITIPLTKFSRLEVEFYKFGGLLYLDDLIMNKRTPGVDKQLLLIIPTEKGHIEKSVLENIKEASKIVGVSTDIINERIKVLKRRDEIGRTGVYMKHELAPDENFESYFDKIIKRDPAVRRMLKKRGYL